MGVLAERLGLARIEGVALFGVLPLRSPQFIGLATSLSALVGAFLILANSDPLGLSNGLRFPLANCFRHTATSNVHSDNAKVKMRTGSSRWIDTEHRRLHIWRTSRL